MGSHRKDELFIYHKENTSDDLCWACSSSQEISSKDGYKGKQKCYSCMFLYLKGLQRNVFTEGVCSTTQVSFREVSLVTSSRRKKKTVMSEWLLYTCLHKVWKLYATRSLIFPTDGMLLAKQMFLTGYSLAVCKQLLSETFPGAYTLLVCWYPSPPVCHLLWP